MAWTYGDFRYVGELPNAAGVQSKGGCMYPIFHADRVWHTSSLDWYDPKYTSTIFTGSAGWLAYSVTDGSVITGPQNSSNSRYRRGTAMTLQYPSGNTKLAPLIRGLGGMDYIDVANSSNRFVFPAMNVPGAGGPVLDYTGSSTTYYHGQGVVCTVDPAGVAWYIGGADFETSTTPREHGFCQRAHSVLTESKTVNQPPNHRNPYWYRNTALCANSTTVFLFYIDTVNKEAIVNEYNMASQTWGGERSIWQPILTAAGATAYDGDSVSAIVMGDGRILISVDLATTNAVPGVTVIYDPSTRTFERGPSVSDNGTGHEVGFCRLAMDAISGRIALVANNYRGVGVTGVQRCGWVYTLDGPKPPATTHQGSGAAKVSLIAIGQFSVPPTISGTGSAKLRFTATGSGEAPVRYEATGSATIAFSAIGEGITPPYAAHIERPHTRRTATQEGAPNRLITHAYFRKLIQATIALPKRDHQAIAQMQPVRLSTAFNGARVQFGKARLPIRFQIWAREGAQAYLFTNLFVDAQAEHTACGVAALTLDLDMTVDASLTVVNGEAHLPFTLDVAGQHGEGLPEGEILPPYESRLRTHLWFYPPPSGVVVQAGRTDPLPIDIGVETEPRKPIVADLGMDPLSIEFDHGQDGWEGEILPAAVLTVGRIRLDIRARGILTQNAEVQADLVSLDTTASYYPWGHADLPVSLDTWAKAVATYKGSWRPLLRLDYINFTGKVTAIAKLRRPLTINLSTTFGSIQDAILGGAQRQRVKLTFTVRGEYVIRVIEPRPVRVTSVWSEPFHIHHRAISEGI